MRHIIFSALGLYVISGNPACAGDRFDFPVALTLEAGSGVGSSRFSGHQDFTILDQPILVQDSDVMGGYGLSYSLAGWVNHDTAPHFVLGLEYRRGHQNYTLSGIAEDGVGILSDATTLTSNTQGYREQVFLNFGWKPVLTRKYQTLLALGLGTGKGHLTFNSSVSSDFLGVIQDRDGVDGTMTSLQVLMGHDIELGRGLFLGARTRYTLDLNNSWAGGRSSSMGFTLVGGYRFGSAYGEKMQPAKYPSRKVRGLRLQPTFEIMQGSYGIDLTATTSSAMGQEQPLPFTSKNLINAVSYLASLNLWMPAGFICGGSSEGERDCPFEIGLQVMHQYGTGRFNAVISSEGPLSGRDQVLNVIGKAKAWGGMINILYSPLDDGDFRPHFGIGMGLLYYDAKAINTDPAQDVFATLSDTGIRFAAQVLMGLDYTISKRLDVGISSRFMIRQIGLGGHVTYRF